MELNQTFGALADPTRFAIVDSLLRNGDQSAGQLQTVAEISPPAISRHLKVLRQAGVIEQRIDAQQRIYSVNPDAMRSIQSWIEETAKFWEGALDRLEAAIDKETSK